MDGTYVSDGIRIKFTKDFKFTYNETKKENLKTVIGIYEKNGDKIKLKGSGIEKIGNSDAQEFILETEINMKNYTREDSFDGTFVLVDNNTTTKIQFTKDLKFTFNESQGDSSRTVIGIYHKEGDNVRISGKGVEITKSENKNKDAREYVLDRKIDIKKYTKQ
jgi:hypothetical protein